MIQLISKPRARQRFDKLCEEKNAEMPTFTVTRSFERDGETITQTYERKKKAISDGAQSTGKCLIQSYAFHFKKLINTLGPEILDEGKLPSLQTNNVKLANFRGNVTDRTIRRHLKELREIGFIQDYQFHGSLYNFELWLNPEVLFGEAEIPYQLIKSEAPEYEKSATETPVFKNSNDTKCPHRQGVSIETLMETKNTTTSKADNHSDKWKPENGNNRSATTQGRKKQQSRVSMETKLAGGGGKIYVENDPKVWISRLEMWKTPGTDNDYSRLPRRYQHYIAEFVKYAEKMLWQGKVFLPEQHFATLDTVTVGVYQPIFAKNPTDQALNAFHRRQMNAIKKAAAYYEKNPNRFPGDPYNNFKEGMGYFCPLNNRGFKVAQRWADQAAAENHERYGQKVLNRAVMHLRNHPQGKTPQKFINMSQTELWRYYETTIKKNYSAELLKDFYNQTTKLVAIR